MLEIAKKRKKKNSEKVLVDLQDGDKMGKSNQFIRIRIRIRKSHFKVQSKIKKEIRKNYR